MVRLSGIFIYPIKAMGGIALSRATIEERGLQYDRRWMLVDEHNQFITQREIPELALFRLEIQEKGLLLHWKEQSIMVPFDENAYPKRAIVQIFDDTLTALIAPSPINQWLSKQLGQTCKLAYQGQSSVRLTSAKYIPAQEVSLADGYPFLLLSEESVELLNEKMESPVLADRFRANFIISGSTPHIEDDFHFYKIGNTLFKAVKPCARCTVITVDQATALVGKEPLKSLATYRKKNKKIYFGQCLAYHGEAPAVVNIGDIIEMIDAKSDQ